MYLQQLVVELHHAPVLLQLQQALAEVESQRKTHFVQRFRVLRPSVHLQARGGQGVIRGFLLKMMQGCGEARRI